MHKNTDPNKNIHIDVGMTMIFQFIFFDSSKRCLTILLTITSFSIHIFWRVITIWVSLLWRICQSSHSKCDGFLNSILVKSFYYFSSDFECWIACWSNPNFHSYWCCQGTVSPMIADMESSSNLVKHLQTWGLKHPALLAGYWVEATRWKAMSWGRFVKLLRLIFRQHEFTVWLSLVS